MTTGRINQVTVVGPSRASLLETSRPRGVGRSAAGRGSSRVSGREPDRTTVFPPSLPPPPPRREGATGSGGRTARPADHLGREDLLGRSSAPGGRVGGGRTGVGGRARRGAPVPLASPSPPRPSRGGLRASARVVPRLPSRVASGLPAVRPGRDGARAAPDGRNLAARLDLPAEPLERGAAGTLASSGRPLGPRGLENARVARPPARGPAPRGSSRLPVDGPFPGEAPSAGTASRPTRPVRSEGRARPKPKRRTGARRGGRAGSRGRRSRRRGARSGENRAKIGRRSDGRKSDGALALGGIGSRPGGGGSLGARSLGTPSLSRRSAGSARGRAGRARSGLARDSLAFLAARSHEGPGVLFFGRGRPGRETAFPIRAGRGAGRDPPRFGSAGGRFPPASRASRASPPEALGALGEGRPPGRPPRGPGGAGRPRPASGGPRAGRPTAAEKNAPSPFASEREDPGEARGSGEGAERERGRRGSGRSRSRREGEERGGPTVAPGATGSAPGARPERGLSAPARGSSSDGRKGAREGPERGESFPGRDR